MRCVFGLLSYWAQAHSVVFGGFTGTVDDFDDDLLLEHFDALSCDPEFVGWESEDDYQTL